MGFAHMRLQEIGYVMEEVRKKAYTVDDIYALSDGQRAELIDGHLSKLDENGKAVPVGIFEEFSICVH